MPMYVVRHSRAKSEQCRIQSLAKKRKPKVERAVAQADIFGRIDFFPPKEEEDKKKKM